MAPDAVAQAEASVSEAVAPAPKGEVADFRLRYGVALHSGSLTDSGPGLSYTGNTPDDVAFAATFFPSQYLGAGVGVQREGFALFEAPNRITGGGLFRGHVGPTGRLEFGPVRIEALAGYGVAQLPGFGSSANPAWAPALRHGVLLASRVMVDVGPLTAEVRGELPIPLAVSAGGVAGTSSDDSDTARSSTTSTSPTRSAAAMSLLRRKRSHASAWRSR
jgi:hypothetical protein